jgi:centromere protein V
MSARLVLHRGGCHCGAVRFEVEAPARIEGVCCNCSICAMTGFEHLIVAARAFRLLAGREVLSCYSFNTGVARHYFCSRCGVKSFYVPRSHPTGYSVNVRCLDRDTVEALSLGSYDGRNWERAAGSLPAVD